MVTLATTNAGITRVCPFQRRILLPTDFGPLIRRVRGGEQYGGGADREVQRWTVKRRAALVLSLSKGQTSTADAASKHGLTVEQVEE